MVCSRQTLLLALTCALTEGLGLIELEGGRWLTTQKIADCGSPDVVEKVCNTNFIIQMGGNNRIFPGLF